MFTTSDSSSSEYTRSPASLCWKIMMLVNLCSCLMIMKSQQELSLKQDLIYSLETIHPCPPHARVKRISWTAFELCSVPSSPAALSTRGAVLKNGLWAYLVCKELPELRLGHKYTYKKSFVKRVRTLKRIVLPLSGLSSPSCPEHSPLPTADLS